MARNDAEYRLHCLVVDLLRFAGKPGLFFFHPANGEYRSPRTGARLKRMGVVRGVPDLVLVWEGRFYGIELKTEKGRITEEQRAAESAIRAAHGQYCVTRGYRQTVAVLELIGCIRPIDNNTRFAPRPEGTTA